MLEREPHLEEFKSRCLSSTSSLNLTSSNGKGAPNEIIHLTYLYQGLRMTSRLASKNELPNLKAQIIKHLSMFAKPLTSRLALSIPSHMCRLHFWYQTCLVHHLKHCRTGNILEADHISILSSQNDREFIVESDFSFTHLTCEYSTK